MNLQQYKKNFPQTDSSGTEEYQRLWRGLKNSQNVKTDYHKGTAQLTVDISIMVSGGQWNNIFSILRDSNCQPRIAYIVKLSRGKEGKIKILFGQMKKSEPL